MAQIDIHTAYQRIHKSPVLAIHKRPRTIIRIPGTIIVRISPRWWTCKIDIIQVFACEKRSACAGLASAHVDGVKEVEAFEALALAVEEDGESYDEEESTSNDGASNDGGAVAWGVVGYV